MHGEAPEQLFASLEQFLQRVHQQGLAEPARTRQEIVIAPFDEAAQMLRLVDVVAVPRPDLPEGGHADRKHASRHPSKVGSRAGAVKESAVARRLRRAAATPARTTNLRGRLGAAIHRRDSTDGGCLRHRPGAGRAGHAARLVEMSERDVEPARLQAVSNSNPTMLRSSRPNSMPISRIGTPRCRYLSA